jgi:hypothetical protein
MKSYKKIALMLKKNAIILFKNKVQIQQCLIKKPFKIFNLFILMNYN